MKQIQLTYGNRDGKFYAALKFGDKEKHILVNTEPMNETRKVLYALIEAFSALKEPCEVTVYTDYISIANAINNNWVEKWSQNGWMTTKKTPVSEGDLWEELWEVMQHHKVKAVKALL